MPPAKPAKKPKLPLELVVYIGVAFMTPTGRRALAAAMPPACREEITRAGATPRLEDVMGFGARAPEYLGWLVEAGYPRLPEAYQWAINAGNAAALRWLAENGWPRREGGAFRLGRATTAVAVLLHEHKLARAWEVALVAARGGDLDTLQRYFNTRDAGRGLSVFCRAVDSGNGAMVRWLLEGPAIEAILPGRREEVRAQIAVARAGRRGWMRLLLRRRPGVQSGAVVAAAVGAGRHGMAAWLITRRLYPLSPAEVARAAIAAGAYAEDPAARGPGPRHGQSISTARQWLEYVLPQLGPREAGSVLAAAVAAGSEEGVADILARFPRLARPGAAAPATPDWDEGDPREYEYDIFGRYGPGDAEEGWGRTPRPKEWEIPHLGAALAEGGTEKMLERFWGRCEDPEAWLYLAAARGGATRAAAVAAKARGAVACPEEYVAVSAAEAGQWETAAAQPLEEMSADARRRVLRAAVRRNCLGVAKRLRPRAGECPMPQGAVKDYEMKALLRSWAAP